MVMNFPGGIGNLALLAFTDPERAAALMAQAGIRPGATPAAMGTPGMPTAPAGVSSTAMGRDFRPNAGANPARGAGAMTAPAAPPAAPPATPPAAPGAGGLPGAGDMLGGLTQALGAVQSLTPPKAVTPQSISAAPAPRPGTVQSDPRVLAQVLQLLGLGGGGAAQPLPSLSALIAGRG